MSSTPQNAPIEKSEGKTSEELLQELAKIANEKRAVFSKPAKDRLDAELGKLIIFQPIYGTVFMYLNKMQTRSVPTMGVGIIREVDLAFFYNPDFLMQLTNTELRAVLIHEALHILLHHIARAEHFSYNRQFYNITADMAINCHIPGLPDRENFKGYYPKTFNLPDFESAEWYYEKLKQEAEKNGGGEKGREKVMGKGELIDNHDGWGDCENEIIKEKVKAVAEKAISAQEGSKGWSNVHSKLAEAIIEANRPTINWKREVRWFINKLVLAGRKNSRSRINRREQSLRKHRNDKLAACYIQPGTKKDYRSKLLVALDTSGSVSDLELEQFVAEINGMVEHVECHVTMFDTQMLCDPFPIRKKIKNLRIQGRGGTNFEPVIRYVEQHKYDGLIMFTDGFAPIGEPPRNVRVMWGITSAGDTVQPPWGKRVRVEIKG